MSKNILVTGGAGYIGSHTVVELIGNGDNVVVVDNFSNSSPVCLERLEQITGKKVKCYNADIRDRKALDKIMEENSIDAVIHFAGLKAVGESCSMPVEYYDNNVYGTIVLLEAMKSHNVKTIVFSSSATVYGDPERLPIDEECALRTTNPYGATKLVIENMLKDLFASDNTWNITLLRYFNPIGAHESGLIGEDPQGIPNNLAPYIMRVAGGLYEYLHVFGNDYDTPDGTGVRDYIHVVDLAKGHLAALKDESAGVHIYNLGTGKGYSVLDVLHAFEKAVGHSIAYKVEGRRPGDIATCFADPSKANKCLGWKAEKGIEEMCASMWNWQQKNPHGFRG